MRHHAIMVRILYMFVLGKLSNSLFFAVLFYRSLLFSFQFSTFFRQTKCQRARERAEKRSFASVKCNIIFRLPFPLNLSLLVVDKRTLQIDGEDRQLKGKTTMCCNKITDATTKSINLLNFCVVVSKRNHCISDQNRVVAGRKHR